MVPTSEKGETICGSLILDCDEDPPTESQIELRTRTMNEIKDFEKKIATCVMPKLLEQQKSRMPSMVSVGSPLPLTTINNTTTSPSFMIQAQTTPGGVANNSYVVVDQSQLKLLMASVNSPTPSRATTTVTSAQIQAQFTPRGMINIPQRGRYPTGKASKIIVTAPSSVQPSGGTAQVPLVVQQTLPGTNNHTIKLPSLSGGWLKTASTSTNTTKTPPAVKTTATVKSSPISPLVNVTPTLPTTSPTPGPAPTAKRSDVVDLTDDGEAAPEETQSAMPPPLPDSTSNKRNQSERTFPSLVVTARVSLNSRNISASVSNRERTELDSRIRRVLALSASVFTEHLLQQRLLRCDQVCAVHGSNLKLGMYSDATRFPFSGGYVWISECCPTNFVSVFTGSIFEGAPHSPTMILKLIYHWSCQTSVQNVMQWVKVDSVYLKTFYTYLRAVCTAAVHEKYPLMGGFKKTIEVGVISLGTTSNDGTMKEVKLDVLGVLDTENRRLRLKAMDHIAVDSKLPPSELEKYLKKKSLRIIEPLEQWVHPESTIVTDFTIDKSLCSVMGFKYIVQGHSSGPSNNMIMDYLRTVIPRMFQNTLSLLSRQIIQQFLDELVWRETWAPVPSRAYDKISEHIAEQTKLETGSTLVNRLSKIALNPSRNWKYAYWQANCKNPQSNTTATALTSRTMSEAAANKRLGNMLHTSRSKALNPSKARPSPKSVAMARAAIQSARAPMPPSMTSPAPGIAEIALEPYYYGTVEGDPKYDTPAFAFIIECVMCKKDFSSNISFSNHLIHHAINEHVSLTNSNLTSICRFCMKTTPMLSVHTKEVHPQFHKGGKQVPTCKICSKTFSTKEDLINHMSITHVELDMPYYCEACGYRTSIYKNMIDHFELTHKKDSCLQCPFCLKIVYVATQNGAEMSRNQLFFVQHVQKHLLPRQVKKCEKCALSFTNLPCLVRHQEHFHSSCRDLEGVERYADEDEFILMAAPLVDPAPPASLSHMLEMSMKTQPPTIKTDPSLNNFNCSECDGPINSPGHFMAKVSCNKCKFQTFCTYAIKEHSARLHSTSTQINQIGRRPILGKASTLAKARYCTACLFTSTDGNALAEHLLGCGSASCVTDKRKAEEMSGLNAMDQSLAKRQKAASASRNKSRVKKRSFDHTDDAARYTGWQMTEDVA